MPVDGVQPHRSDSFEKDVEEFEHSNSLNTPHITNDFQDHQCLSRLEEKRLLRRIDFHLLPWLSLLYLLSFLDRTSIGNAKLYGMAKNLHITDSQYNAGLSVFFVSYAVFEVPSNIILKRLRPSIWLAVLMFFWGVVMTTQGFIHNYSSLLVTRWFLGMFEAGLFPGVNYMLSCWYKRSELGIRTAIFFAAASLSGAFGGLLSVAISKMHSVGGLPNWSWIFILEGLGTVVAGILCLWLVQDFPDTARFLTDEQRAAIVHRLQEDGQFSAAGEGLRKQAIWEAISSPRTWLCMVFFCGSVMPLYAFSLFLPSIIKELGYTSTKANLLTVPVYAFACIVTVMGGWIADRRQQRGYLHMIYLSIATTGYIILIVSRNPALSYFATFVAAAGIYLSLPNAIAWFANNVEGSYKRGATLGMIMSFANLNGVVSSNVYMAKDGPWFRLGHGIVLLYIIIGLTGSVLYQSILRRENAIRDRGERDEVIGGDLGEKSQVLLDADIQDRVRLNGKFESVEAAKRMKGDAWSGYRYML